MQSMHSLPHFWHWSLWHPLPHGLTRQGMQWKHFSWQSPHFESHAAQNFSASQLMQRLHWGVPWPTSLMHCPRDSQDPSAFGSTRQVKPAGHFSNNDFIPFPHSVHEEQLPSAASSATSRCQRETLLFVLFKLVFVKTKNKLIYLGFEHFIPFCHRIDNDGRVAIHRNQDHRSTQFQICMIPHTSCNPWPWRPMRMLWFSADLINRISFIPIKFSSTLKSVIYVYCFWPRAPWGWQI